MPRLLTILRLLLVLAMLMGTGAFFGYAKIQTDLDREFFRNFTGFHDLSRVEFYSLMDSHAELPIELEVETKRASGETTIRFSLVEESMVYLSASADSAETVLVQPLILTRENGRRSLLPLIRSSTEGRSVWSSVRLGKFGAGDHVIVVSPGAELRLPIPESIQFSATRPSHDSTLATFIDQHPVIEVKNPSNLLDDIPLMGYSHIYQRGADYKVTSHLIFSSENGGTMPPRLMSSFQRTVDIEWVMKQVFERDGDKLQVSHRQYQSRSHRPRPFEGRKELQGSPVLSVATPNNNFGEGQSSFLGFMFPLSIGAESEPIVYAPKPIFLPSGSWSKHLLDTYPEMQEWSMFELALEGCVDLSKRDDPSVQDFERDLAYIRQHLAIEYPDRGCGNRLLELPSQETANVTSP